MSQEYNEYIKSLDWKRKRTGFIARAGYACQDCGAEDVTLQVHHLHYDTLGCETEKDVRVLCLICHPAADKKRAQAQYEAIQNRALDTYATRKYGKYWEDYGAERIAEEFDRWQRRKAERGY